MAEDGLAHSLLIICFYYLYEHDWLERGNTLVKRQLKPEIG